MIFSLLILYSDSQSAAVSKNFHFVEAQFYKFVFISIWKSLKLYLAMIYYKFESKSRSYFSRSRYSYASLSRNSLNFCFASSTAFACTKEFFLKPTKSNCSSIGFCAPESLIGFIPILREKSLTVWSNLFILLLFS